MYNNDTVIVHNDKNEMPDNSIHLYQHLFHLESLRILNNFNDMGHNLGK